MDTGWRRFNIYLAGLLAAGALCGCQSTTSNKTGAVLRVHAEARNTTTFTRKITVYRHAPLEMTVDQSVLLNETMVKSAKVVDTMGGGFALSIQFEKRGQWLLDEHSSLNLGRHLAIYAMFGEKNAESRWLAAPIISNRISDGLLLFTPDATRAEAMQIAESLNRLAGSEPSPSEDILSKDK